MIIEKLKEYTTKEGLTVVLEVADFCEGSPWLGDLYTPSEKHIAGTTIKVPSYLQQTHSPKYYIYDGYTPATLAKEYAKQGRKNPSREAYESLQKELAHYIQASDCAIKCTVSKCGVELCYDYSSSFDWSIELDDTVKELALKYLKEDDSFINYAINDALETLEELAA